MQLHHSPIRRSFSRFLSTLAILEVPGTKSLPRFTLKKLSSTPTLSYYYDIGSHQHGNKRLGKMFHTHMEERPWEETKEKAVWEDKRQMEKLGC
jgi:hypothetical protein